MDMHATNTRHGRWGLTGVVGGGVAEVAVASEMLHCHAVQQAHVVYETMLECSRFLLPLSIGLHVGWRRACVERQCLQKHQLGEHLIRRPANLVWPVLRPVRVCR
jgi:hypothetical protein